MRSLRKKRTQRPPKSETGTAPQTRRIEEAPRGFIIAAGRLSEAELVLHAANATGATGIRNIADL
jgi:hypothetical protein